LPPRPALYVTGERDTYGPPALLREFVEIPGRRDRSSADHFFEGKLDELEAVLGRFLAELPPRRRRGDGSLLSKARDGASWTGARILEAHFRNEPPPRLGSTGPKGRAAARSS
jgi:hypothetical protein